MDSSTPQATRVVRPPTVILSLLALGILGAGGYFGWQYLRSLGGQEPANVAVNANVNEPTQPDDSPARRDQDRYAAVNLLKIALAGYYGDFREYPESLSPLAPKYVSQLPTDPQTGAPYDYRRDDRSYVITFTLEAGVLALSPGKHTLSPNGIDVVPEQSAVPPESVTSVGVIAADPSLATPPSDTAPPDESQPPFPSPETPVQPSADADADGVPDEEEAVHGADPANPDSDGDGIKDGDEIYRYKTNAASRDTDDDGFTDMEELLRGFDPTVAGGRWPDADADGLSDPYEGALGTDPSNADSDGDTLGDGAEARVYRTSPLQKDSDGDGFDDNTEIQGGYEPNGPGTMTDERKAQIDADFKTYPAP